MVSLKNVLIFLAGAEFFTPFPISIAFFVELPLETETING